MIAQKRARERGMTLIEVSISLGIAAVLFAAVTVSIGAVTGTKAKASASELAGVIRSLYDTAALSGKTCRLVFDMADPKARERRDEVPRRVRRGQRHHHAGP